MLQLGRIQWQVISSSVLLIILPGGLGILPSRIWLMMMQCSMTVRRKGTANPQALKGDEAKLLASASGAWLGESYLDDEKGRVIRTQTAATNVDIAASAGPVGAAYSEFGGFRSKVHGQVYAYAPGAPLNASISLNVAHYSGPVWIK